ncbi:MAG: hypothetical protein HY360_02790 [Verrucomicrobia bacterium]|nr:hypothetical protein [Verrucomicrobiota bacterium]
MKFTKRILARAAFFTGAVVLTLLLVDWMRSGDPAQPPSLTEKISSWFSGGGRPAVRAAEPAAQGALRTNRLATEKSPYLHVLDRTLTTKSSPLETD